MTLDEFATITQRVIAKRRFRRVPAHCLLSSSSSSSGFSRRSFRRRHSVGFDLVGSKEGRAKRGGFGGLPHRACPVQDRSVCEWRHAGGLV
nr:hypothetical protein [uncultured bacterium]